MVLALALTLASLPIAGDAPPEVLFPASGMPHDGFGLNV
ncbi:MAG: hypothetical protein ACI841_005290, partial [Planctomycetota bacterium]